VGEDGGCCEDRPCCLEVKKMVKEGEMQVDDKRTQGLADTTRFLQGCRTPSPFLYV
jgi:hypothetical protein